VGLPRKFGKLIRRDSPKTRGKMNVTWRNFGLREGNGGGEKRKHDVLGQERLSDNISDQWRPPQDIGRKPRRNWGKGSDTPC